MAITDSMIKIADWLNNAVCPNYKFKVPPEGRVQDNNRKQILAPMDDGYQYQEVNPYAFVMFLPTKDKIPPPGHPNMPSVCVQLVSGSDDLLKGSREMTVNLACSCWNPGIHAQDIYFPKGSRPERTPHFEPSYTGWMDAWNLVDGILMKLGEINILMAMYRSLRTLRLHSDATRNRITYRIFTHIGLHGCSLRYGQYFTETMK